MSDKEYLMDTLDTLKCLSVNMTYAMNEASCDKIYKEYLSMFKEINKETKEINKETKEVFDLAYRLGYYTLESEDEKKIKSAIKTLSQELESSSEEDKK